MPKLTVLPFVLACLAAALPGSALAQVTVDLHALDAAPTPPPPQAPAPKPARPPVRHAAPPHRAETRPAEARPAEPRKEEARQKPKEEAKPSAAAPIAAPTVGSAAPAALNPAAPAAAPRTPPPPVVGLAPPPVAVIPPPAPADAPMPPPPPPTIKASAGTRLDALPPKEGKGLRLDFAHDDSDLTQQTADAVKALVDAAPKDDDVTYNVLAYAAGVPEDPSTARRLSLQRALSVRSALMAYGVPSTRIYLRALGEQAGEGPADRVDVEVMGANAAGAVAPDQSPSGAARNP
jgi:outer membrane protein OmpA-like peptidoglycan-associated protein